MSGALHPALAPLLAGGGAPERLAVTAAELRARIERLLSPPPPRLLDDDVLASLTAPMEPGDTLEAVLARLAGDRAEGDMPTAHARPAPASPGGSVRTGSAASSPLPADIVAHARALPQPLARVGSVSETPAPVFDAPGRAAAAGPGQPPAGYRPTLAPRVGGRDWQAEAAQLGADRPLRIVAEPPPETSVPGRAGADGGPASRGMTPSLASIDTGAEVATSASALWSGGSASPGDSDGAPPVARAFGPRIARGATSTSSPNKASPTAAGAVREAATPGPAGTRPRLHAVTMPQGARVGGFAGLASLGRAASPEDEAAVLAPHRAPTPTSQTAARAAESAADRAPPPDAKAVIAELTDALRLQMLAAGIDLSGRRP